MAVGDSLTTGTADLRSENVNRAVIGFALQSYKFKQVCLIQKSGSWKETFFKEQAAELSGGASRSLEGVPRLASFPYLEPTWIEVNARLIKHAGEGVISMEDKMTDDIDVMARTLLRVARAIAKSVDDAIYTALIGDSDINTAAAIATWDNATVANRDPIRDILTGIQTILEYNYDVQENGYLLLSPKDHRNLMMNSKVINNPSFKTADVVSNGKVGQIAGLTIIVSNSVPADEALIIKGQTACTWKTAAALTTQTIDDVGIKTTIRAWEIGVPVITNPRAIHRITDTQA